MLWLVSAQTRTKAQVHCFVCGANELLGAATWLMIAATVLKGPYMKGPYMSCLKHMQACDPCMSCMTCVMKCIHDFHAILKTFGLLCICSRNLTGSMEELHGLCNDPCQVHKAATDELLSRQFKRDLLSVDEYRRDFCFVLPDLPSCRHPHSKQRRARCFRCHIDALQASTICFLT